MHRRCEGWRSPLPRLPACWYTQARPAALPTITTAITTTTPGRVTLAPAPLALQERVKELQSGSRATSPTWQPPAPILTAPAEGSPADREPASNADLLLSPGGTTVRFTAPVSYADMAAQQAQQQQQGTAGAGAEGAAAAARVSPAPVPLLPLSTGPLPPLHRPSGSISSEIEPVEGPLGPLAAAGPQDSGHLLEPLALPHSGSRADSLFASQMLTLPTGFTPRAGGGPPGPGGDAAAAAAAAGGALGSDNAAQAALKARLESLERELEDR